MSMAPTRSLTAAFALLLLTASLPATLPRFARQVARADDPQTAAVVLPRFTDRTRQAGIRFEHHDAPPLPFMLAQEQSKFGAGAAVSDFDRDGDLDLYLVDSAGFANRLYSNRGDGTFTDVTATAEVGDLGAGHMALFLDLDNDGFDDLVVFNDTVGDLDGTLQRYPFSQIYRNRGDGSFVNVSSGSGFEPLLRIIGGATAGDYDRDGDLDIYVTGWFDYANLLYRNEGNFVFTEVTAAAGLRLPETFVPQWAPIFADFDNDGWPDIYGAVDYFEDYLFLNNHDGTFRLVEGDYSEANDMGLAVADFDDDGDLDLYTTNITDPSQAERCCNYLWRNDGVDRGFASSAVDHGVLDTAWGWGTAFFDANLDGRLDLAAVNGWQQPEWNTPACLFLDTGHRRFVDLAARCGIAHVGNSRCLLPFDSDGDGDHDLLISDVYGPFTFYENTTPRDDRHYLTVRLVGRTSNRNGVGARVYVKAGGRVRMHEITVGGSFYAGPALEAHFGLGRTQKIDSVTVRWPSGLRSRLRDVACDQTLTIVERTAPDR